MRTESKKVAKYDVVFFAESDYQSSTFWVFDILPFVDIERYPLSLSVIVGWGFWKAGVSIGKIEEIF